ncbi:MAG: SDR family NAD(P)-dependent oxidoreductase [Candidatus Lokiarchaeota archaeon]|nr:SDR family NAD(P)-dependent oxidoreductase [Candidatus Lokiarchaeota archaeon]MBD3201166.1 SDR family NAD(P)-dependent oxidoreductase [Candidatus Lokiarchaeota archaeon]
MDQESIFENKTVLVTGAAGFIGSNLVDRLLKLGARVIGLDNLFNGRLSNVKDARKSQRFIFHKGDVRDFNFLLDITQDVDIIYHEAAFTSVPQSVKMPSSCNDVNVNGILNILNASLKNEIEKVIFASSSSVYGDTPTLPKKEDMKRIPISPYGVSKLACEAYMQTYNHVYGLDTIALRYFNVFGPRQKDSTYSGVIAIWLGNILRDENLTIFGDGKNSRDFTYIKDVVQANLLAAKSDSPGEIINIGAGNPISLNDLADLMLKITNKRNLKINHTDPRPGDIIHSFADISKAKRLLGFNPKYNQEEGLIDYLEWYKKQYSINLDINK